MSLFHIDEEVPCPDYTRSISSSFHATSGYTHSTTSALTFGFQHIRSRYSSIGKISKSVHRANPGRWIWGLLTRFTTIFQLDTVLAGKWFHSDVITTSLILPLQESQLHYPTLFSGVLDIFPIQGSAVPCERVFSSAKETTTARRNQINANLMEALQMLKFSLKQDQGLNFTLGTSKDAEILDLEQSSSDQATVPEDINGFIRRLQGESSI